MSSRPQAAELTNASGEHRCCVCDHPGFHVLYSKTVVHPLLGLQSDATFCVLRYIQCSECGFISLFPALQPDEYALYYREVPPPSAEAFAMRSRQYEDRSRFIRSVLTCDPGTVLEIGAGRGDMLMRFEQATRRIAVEPSRAAAEDAAGRNLPIEYHSCMLADVELRAPELQGQADLVISSHVLEHAIDPRVFLLQAVRLLKPDGLLYLEVPSTDSLAVCSDAVVQTLHIGHVSLFSRSTLNRMLHRCGMETLRTAVTTAYGFPALRGAYVRVQNPAEIAADFLAHAGRFDAIARQGAERLLASLAECPLDHSGLLWGCGQDCLDILGALTDGDTDRVRAQVRLVDMNPRKQGKTLGRLIVENPKDLVSARISTAFITSRSQLISADMEESIRRLFPKARVVPLYSSSPDARSVP